jgi:hypothetical protein
MNLGGLGSYPLAKVLLLLRSRVSISVPSHSLFRDGSQSAAEQSYLKGLDLVLRLKRLLGFNDRMIRGEAELATIHTASDYSYSASSYAGENWWMAAFIDLFFSSGVHLALASSFDCGFNSWRLS